MCFAQVLGMALDQAGRGPLNVLAANLVGPVEPSRRGASGTAGEVATLAAHPSAAPAWHAPRWAVSGNDWIMTGWQAEERG